MVLEVMEVYANMTSVWSGAFGCTSAAGALLLRIVKKENAAEHARAAPWAPGLLSWSPAAREEDRVGECCEAAALAGLRQGRFNLYVLSYVLRTDTCIIIRREN